MLFNRTGGTANEEEIMRKVVCMNSGEITNEVNERVVFGFAIFGNIRVGYK